MTSLDSTRPSPLATVDGPPGCAHGRRWRRGESSIAIDEPAERVGRRQSSDNATPSSLIPLGGIDQHTVPGALPQDRRRCMLTEGRGARG